MDVQIAIPLIFTVLVASFWLWMAWDLGSNDRLSRNEKLYWMAAFLFLNVFAAGFYFVYVYRNRQ